MNIKIEEGVLKLDVGDFCESLDADSRRIVAKQLGADAFLWKQALEALADPDDFYNTAEEEHPWWFDRGTMLEVRKQLLPLMPEVSRLALQEAERQRDEAKAEAERTRASEKRLADALVSAEAQLKVLGRDTDEIHAAVLAEVRAALSEVEG